MRAVVGESHRIHAQILHAVQHLGHFLQPIEQCVMAVVMQMDKFGQASLPHTSRELLLMVTLIARV